jgi:hypothetical protein
MVEFYRTPINYENLEARYIYYYQLFPDVDNQESRVAVVASHGWPDWGVPENPPNDATPKEEYRLHYFVDGFPRVAIKNVLITISGDGIGSKTYDMLNNPNTVKICCDDAFAMGLKELVPLRIDGVEDIANSPHLHSVKTQFDTLPLDNVNYLIEVIGDDNEVVMQESGMFSIIPSPWETVT